LTGRAPVCVSIGSASAQAGWLRAGPRGQAEIALEPNGALALEDRSIDVVACAPGGTTRSRAQWLRLLLECRRALRPDGELCIGARANASPPDPQDLPALAIMAGLRPTGRDAPSALAAWLAAEQPAVAQRFSKPERTVNGEPSVTIAIPAYSARYFGAALASCLGQTYGNVDIVVCDDSADGAIERIVRAVPPRRPVRYRRNETRLGVRANYRRCLETADGEFVKLLCDDDVLAPDCVARLVDAFRRAPDVSLAASHRRRIDERGAALADDHATVAPVRRSAVIAGPSLANVMIMAGINFVGEPSTVLFRKADLADHAPAYFVFDGAPGHGIIDMVTWASLLLKGDAVYLRDSLSDFRIHPGQRQNDPAKRARNRESVHELQRAWGALDLHTWCLPEHLMVKPFPPAARDPWRLMPVRTPAARLAFPTGP